MNLELDSQDIHLLKELAELGDVSSRVLDQDHRLERLELEGYVSSVRQDPPARMPLRLGFTGSRSKGGPSPPDGELHKPPLVPTR